MTTTHARWHRFFTEREGQLVTVRVEGGANVTGIVEHVHEDAVDIRPDRPPRRLHVFRLAAIVHATEMTKNGTGNPTSHHARA